MADISIRVKALKFDKYSRLAEAAIIDALDVIAAEIQVHARSGHTKINQATIRRARGDKFVLDTYRERSGEGEYKGMPRFLTHTGVTRGSIQIQKAHAEGSGLTRTLIARVYSAQKHAPELEFGGPGRRAFPFLRPAIIAKEARGPELLAAALKKAEAGL